MSLLQGSCHFHSHSLLTAMLLPSEAFWTFLEPVKIPDYVVEVGKELVARLASILGGRGKAGMGGWRLGTGTSMHIFYLPQRARPGSLHPLGSLAPAQPTAPIAHSLCCPALLV